MRAYLVKLGSSASRSRSVPSSFRSALRSSVTTPVLREVASDSVRDETMSAPEPLLRDLPLLPCLPPPALTFDMGT